MSIARRTTAVSASLLAVLAGVGPAVAAGGPAVVDAPLDTVSGPGISAHRTAPHGRILNSTSSNWSGYAATGSTFNSVSASWVEPTGNCSSTDTYSSFWVGLDGDGSNSVEQTGTEVDCSGGSPQYYSWYEMYPSAPVNFSDTVEPGDHFNASVTYNGNGAFTLVLSDTTRGWSHTVNKTLSNPSLASAEVIAEAPSDSSGPLPLTDFGTVNFTNAEANGQAIGTYNPDNITMASGGTTLATASSLSNGTDFSDTWKASS
ncbi:G1 family endopeptidase [Streptomyces sp. RB6PN25]|uniref:G1 family endopeptidase n=1 Tax=Streptomyces humicola TaxID=2953240 RepID=A0ABT1PPL1_9ACTN|nr:G1 family glutamic endopeptidase [Streptomyces humicola]MCQ4079617.1 G1 family endopeptidase [Streptomyces humicola]